MFKQIITSLFIALSISTSAIAGLQSEKFFDNTGGLLDRVSPLLVPSKNASAISNVNLNSRGQLTKRNGYVVLNTLGALGASGARQVTGGAYHDAASGTDFFVVIVGTSVYRVTNTFGTGYTAVTGTMTLTASAVNLAQASSLNDKLIFCNESDRPFYVGSTGNALAIETTTVSSATTCTTNSNYLVLGNTIEAGIAYPTRIRWSDIANQNSFPANNYIDVDPSDGDKIISIINFEDKIYIFKKRAIYQMLVTGSDGANAFIIRPLARNIGAWAKNSVKVIPNVGVVFLAQNTVYTINDGGLEPIGDAIQTTIDGLNRTQYKNAIGEVYPKQYQYWLAVSEDTNSPKLVLVYDYIQKAWTKYSFGTDVLMLAQAEDSAGNNLLLMGDSHGFHYKQDSGTSDYPSNVKTSISSTYTTADLNFNSPDVNKNFKYLYLYSNTTSSTTVTVEAGIDFDSDYPFSQDITLGSVGAVYDTAIYDTDFYASSIASIRRIELNLTGKVLKLRFSNSTADAALGITGWSVIYTPENFNQ